MEFKTAEEFDAFSTKLFGQLVQTIKLANKLPSEGDFDFMTNSSVAFRDRSTTISKKILEMSQGIMHHHSDGKAPIIDPFFSTDDFTDDSEQYGVISDAVDGILEQVDSWVDEMNGLKNNKANIQIQPRTQAFRRENPNKNSNVPKPQLKFDGPPIDNSNTPWKPIITVKPNALQPLDTRIRPDESYPHPYELEIKKYDYTPSQLVHAPERIYQTLSHTPFSFVTKVDQLEKLAKLLDSQTEIAIDLEAHSYRTFQGFVCLMQISTRMEDFIVDTLALRSKLHVLNSSFTNPKIVKVLHGSDSDIIWLQRDFGLYIVNLFDTGQASRVLEFPKFSLAWLLSYYCDVEADKQYQMADWRIRPIPEVMLKYAREDTHYLLYIYDRMRNELLERPAGQNLLLMVLERSREICLKKYEKERLQETSHLVLYNKYNLVFNPKQMRVFAALYAWRDSVARAEDESTGYILPNHMLFRIADNIPTSPTDLMACCNPLPQAVRLNADHIQNLINSVVKEPESPEPNKQVSKVIVKHTDDHLAGYEDEKRRRGLPNESPVLTTNQLYHTARWVEGPSTPLNSKSRSQVELAICSPINNGNNISVNSLSGLFSDDAEEDNDEDLKRSRKTASIVHASILAEKPRPIIYEKAKQKGVKEQVPEPIKEEAKSDSVPQSMAEIYELSNQIKRKRSQKKQKETEVPKPTEEGSEEETGKKRQKGTDKNAEDFMKDIGWMDKNEVVEPPLKSSEPKKGKPGNLKDSSDPKKAPPRGSKKPPMNVAPYDYSVHQKDDDNSNKPPIKDRKSYKGPSGPARGGKGSWNPKK